jgi:hypothetical protein
VSLVVEFQLFGWDVTDRWILIGSDDAGVFALAICLTEVSEGGYELFGLGGIPAEIDVEFDGAVAQFDVGCFLFDLFPESLILFFGYFRGGAVDGLQQELQVLFQVLFLVFFLGKFDCTIFLKALKMISTFSPGLITPFAGLTSNIFSIFVLI